MYFEVYLCSCGIVCENYSRLLAQLVTANNNHFIFFNRNTNYNKNNNNIKATAAENDGCGRPVTAATK